MSGLVYWQQHEAYQVVDGVVEIRELTEWGALYRPVTDDETIAGVLARAAERDALRAHAAKGRRAFVRYGELPESGYSYNHMDNRPEAGVSVYAAWITTGSDDEPLLADPVVVAELTQAQKVVL